MQKHIRLVCALFICITGFVTLSASAKSNNSPQPFLSDSIEAALSDTSFVLSLPLIITLDSVPVFPPELIQDRLSCLQSTIPLHYNQYVQGFVNYFTIRNRKYTRRILERENVYFPLFEKYLAKHNLPDELKYLSVVESALNPKAMSWAKAVGLWQFMAPTAGDFKLQINSYVDERMDPEKSTEAACKFLKSLHRMFGDWELALAAYNCGPGNVRKAIARAGGGKKTFWEIFPYLPKETRSYVPSFTAVVYAMNHVTDHELTPDTLLYAVETDTVLINQSLDLKKFALQLNLPEDEITKLNPAIRNSFLPETVRNFPVKVPVEKRELLALNRAAILDSCKLPLIIKPQPALEPVTMLATASPVKKESNLPNSTADSAATDSLVRTEYIVAKGDFLQRIAQKHQVTIAQLKEWNNLKNQTLRSGQKLTLYLSATEATAENQSGPVAETEQPTKKAIGYASAKRHHSAQTKKLIEEVKQTHAVQPGDTLWNISKRLNVPVDQIRKLNKLKNDEIKPGQKLILS